MNSYTNYKYVNFLYKDQIYNSGTKLLFNGSCYINNEEINFNNEVVTWLYAQNGDEHLLYNGAVYTCPSWGFKNKIIKIVYDTPTVIQSENPKKEVYWTDSMVAKTLWYIVIMLAATIFKDRIVIWIFATIIWFTSTFNNN